jgi:hypothetical protein
MVIICFYIKIHKTKHDKKMTIQKTEHQSYRRIVFVCKSKFPV